MDHFDAPPENGEEEFEEIDLLRLENKFLRFRLSQHELKETQENLVRKSNQVKKLKLKFQEAWEEFRRGHEVEEEDYLRWKEKDGKSNS